MVARPKVGSRDPARELAKFAPVGYPDWVAYGRGNRPAVEPEVDAVYCDVDEDLVAVADDGGYDVFGGGFTGFGVGGEYLVPEFDVFNWSVGAVGHNDCSAGHEAVAASPELVDEAATGSSYARAERRPNSGRRAAHNTADSHLPSQICG